MYLLLLTLPSFILLAIAILMRQAFIPPEDSPDKICPTQKSPRIAFLGDSLTHGRIGENFVKMLQKRFTQTVIINAGGNSDVSDSALKRIDQLIPCRPHLTYVLIGTNDIKTTLSEQNMKMYMKTQKLNNKIDKHSYERNLEAIVKQLKHIGSDVVLISPPTITETVDSEPFRRSTEFAKITKKVADKLSTDYIPFNETMAETLQKIFR